MRAPPPPLRSDDLLIERSRWLALGARAWREWCFIRSLLERLWLRLLILLIVLLVGALLFLRLEPELHESFPSALYATYALIFANPLEDFPKHPALQALFFLVPLVGLTVIIEGIVETATLVRDRRRNERAWCRIMAESMRDHVILVGLGRLGFRTYAVLKQMHARVVVLELDDRNQFLSDVRRDGTPLFLGDARRESLLVDANVLHARAIILATTDDLANLEIALDARKLNPQIRVVLRLFDQNMADKIRDGFNIHTAMSQSAMAAPAFATAALEAGIVSSTIIDHQLVVTARVEIGPASPLAGQSVGQIAAAHRLVVVRRAGADSTDSELFPDAATTVGVGDSLLVQGLYERVGQVIGPSKA